MDRPLKILALILSTFFLIHSPLLVQSRSSTLPRHTTHLSSPNRSPPSPPGQAHPPPPPPSSKKQADHRSPPSSQSSSKKQADHHSPPPSQSSSKKQADHHSPSSSQSSAKRSPSSQTPSPPGKLHHKESPKSDGSPPKLEQSKSPNLKEQGGRQKGNNHIEGAKQQTKINMGKKMGLTFLGVAAALQILVAGFLSFKRWQISKMKDSQWDFSA